MRYYTLISIIILFFAVIVVDGQKWSDYNNVKRNGRNSAYVGENENDKSAETSTPAKNQQSKTVQVNRAGIGGWGIIAIALTVIFSGIGIYYFVLFYPVVCKKERMYDGMGMTTV